MPDRSKSLLLAVATALFCFVGLECALRVKRRAADHLELPAGVLHRGHGDGPRARAEPARIHDG